MRPELLDPITDRVRLREAVRLAKSLYALYEAGEDITCPLNELSALVGAPVSKGELRGYFGSVSAENCARTLLSMECIIPKDLSKPEMLELLKRIFEAEGTEFQIGYWVRVLEVNTGNDRISDLIYWPDVYFGDRAYSAEMSLEEILETALAEKTEIIALPPLT